VSSGIATIPKANTSTYGVVKLATSNSLYLLADGSLAVTAATQANCKSGDNNSRTVTPAIQHVSVFYGLAKAAGDTTMSSSSNAVGTYTTEAKAAIHTMLGIDPASIAA